MRLEANLPVFNGSPHGNRLLRPNCPILSEKTKGRTAVIIVLTTLVLDRDGRNRLLLINVEQIDLVSLVD